MTRAIRLAFAVCVFIAPAAANAQPYLFAGISQTRVTTRTAPDTSGTDYSTMQFGAGYRFNKYLSTELSYLGLGHYDTQQNSWTASGFGAAVVGTMRMTGAWSMLGKAGFYRLDSELVICCSTATKTSLGSLPAIALGVQYQATPELSVHGLFQMIGGKTGTDLDNIKMLSIGATLSF